MSANLSAKDKVILDPTAKPEGKKGAIHLDPTDSEAITEYFSRQNPGDEVNGKFKATLDENGEKAITLSITEIEIIPGDDEPELPAKADESDEAAEGDENEPAAVTMLKNSEGVPDQAGNNPPEVET